MDGIIKKFRKKRTQMLPLFKFGIEIEGMLCKKDAGQPDLSKLKCFYASDWIPSNTNGARFGVDGRDDTWELATNPHTKVSDLINNIRDIIIPTKDWFPKESSILCGPFFHNENRSGSTNRNRASSPCGLHISLSLPDKFNKVYKKIMYNRYTRGDSLYLFIQQLLPTSMLNNIEGNLGLFRRDCNYGIYGNSPFREKSEHDDGFNGYEYRIFSSCADELLEVYINVYLFISWIFWSNYIYHYNNYSNREYFINNYLNGSITIMDLINTYYDFIIDLEGDSIIKLYNSDFFKNRDNVELYEFFDNYFGVNKKIGLCFTYLDSKYSDENNKGIQYVDLLDAFSINYSLDNRKTDYCTKCLRVSNSDNDRCSCRNYHCYHCGDNFSSASYMCQHGCNRCNDCCNCNSCERCGYRQNRCECSNCDVCGEYDDHISCDCHCDICADCGEQFSDIARHVCPECNRHICQGSITEHRLSNRCCGSRFRFEPLIYIGENRLIRCNFCGFLSRDIHRQECNCGYCSRCDMYVQNIDRHSCVQLQNEDVTTNLGIAIDDLFSEDESDLDTNHYGVFYNTVTPTRLQLTTPQLQLRYRPTIRSDI
jgi:hypothetical protein